MNYRTLSDRELITMAERRFADEDALAQEVLYRLARSCGHSAAPREPAENQEKRSFGGPRQGALHVRSE